MNEKPRHALRVALAICLLSLPAFGILEQPNQAQSEREREVEAVVRNKTFFKKGHFEVSATGGIMPYDSAVSHTLFGGRLTWHLSDHYGWEMVDAQLASSSIPSFTTDLVSTKGLSNLQLTALKVAISSSFLFSPIYGKFRLFGATVMYYDIYGVIGGGLAQTDNLMFSTTASNGVVTRSVVKTAWDPMVNAGIGMRVFLTSTFGFLIDLRDYITYSESYGKKTIKNNFQVGLGISIFLPSY